MTKLTTLALVALTFGTQLAFAQTPDVYKNIYDAVDQNHLIYFLKNLTGVTPVTVGSQTFSITERYSSQGKKNFRAYWTSVFASLGIPVKEMAYKTKHTKIESEGHNLEAVLPGRLPDSIIIIVHYDSMGKRGSETSNPGVDDDMTGMAMMLETARLLTAVRGQLQYTVRFVAADFEEWGNPGLEGARVYSKYIKQLSVQNNFKLVASIDNEQSGWSGGSTSIVDVFSCVKNPGKGLPNSNALGDLFADTASRYSGLKVFRACMGQNSDFYATLEVGVPSVVFSEHNPFANPHFDSSGGDTFDKIDQTYFFRISQIGITFAARVVQINSDNFELLTQR